MPVFTPIEQIEELTDVYLRSDERFQMMAKNGMTREVFLNYSILNSFINENDLQLPTDEHGVYTEASVVETANKCAEYYHRLPEELIKDYNRCIGLDFLDPEVQRRIQTGWKELSN